MKRSMRTGLMTACACCLMIASCEKVPVEVGDEELNFGKGVFILNEGQFLSANASLSYFDPAGASLQNQVFYRANGVPLGDVAHSMTVYGDEAFIVVNNSGKIYRAGLQNMEYTGKIAGLVSPRCIRIVPQLHGNPKGYISDLYSGRILVVDPLAGKTLDSIDISGAGDRLSTEEMILYDGKLYVACWSYGKHILVIDTGTDRLIDSIEVGKQPNSMVLDADGFLWILSDGGFPMSPFGQEKATLTRIDLQTRMPETMHTWDDIGASPTDLCLNPAADSLYFIAQGVYKVSLGMEGFDEPLIREKGRQFYSLGVDPLDGTVYIGDAVDYQQDGWVYRYRSDGRAVDSFRVGVNPGFFCFSYPGQP